MRVLKDNRNGVAAEAVEVIRVITKMVKGVGDVFITIQATQCHHPKCFRGIDLERSYGRIAEAGGIIWLGQITRECFGCGIKTIQGFDPSGLPVRIAGEIVGFDAKNFVDKKDRKSLRVMA